MDDGCGGVDHGFVTLVGFVRSHGDALELFDLAKEVLDEVTPFIHFLVDLQWCASLRSLRNNDFRAALIHFLNDPVGIISFIRDQGAERNAVDERRNADRVVAIAGQ